MEVGGFQQIENGAVFPPKRSFAQKIRFRIIITILFPPSVVDPRNVRLKGELEMIEIERKFAILEITERGSEFFPSAIPSNRGNSNNRP